MTGDSWCFQRINMAVILIGDVIVIGDVNNKSLPDSSRSEGVSGFKVV